LSQNKEPSRIKNYRLAKENYQGELPWLRIEAFAKLKLKRPVVLLNGSFDLLHSGHMKNIFHARKHAKTLVCALDSDAKVARCKPGRPILSWIERATSLGYMPLDYLVEINGDEEFCRLVELIQPDLRVLGAEYRSATSRIPDVPALYVHQSGMRTSEIIRRINNANNRPDRGNS
jgi:cytidyltransferase-like protein